MVWSAGAAGGAVAGDGEVVRVRLEAVVRTEAAGDRLEHVGGKVDHDAARLTDRVVVRLVGEVIGGRAVTEVHVLNEVDLLERFERAIDRRSMDLRPPCVDQLRKLVDGEMLVRRVEQHFEDRSPRLGDTTSAGAETVQQLIQSGFGHDHHRRVPAR